MQRGKAHLAQSVGKVKVKESNEVKNQVSSFGRAPELHAIG